MSEEQKQSYFRIRTNPMRIRQAASMNLNGYWWIYFIGIFVYYFFSDILINIVSRYFPSGYMVIPMSNLPEEIQKSVTMPQIPVVLFFYVLLMSGAFELGRAVYSLSALRNRLVIPRLVFEGFSVYFRATVICVIRYLLTALGFMCFFFPGIVVNYAYSQAYYLLAEDEKRSVIDCLRESRRMMVGNKLTLFRLDLTYFFLVFASYLPSYILVGNGTVSVDGINGMLTFYLLQIPYFMAMSSFCMGRTVFYELLRFGSFKNFKYRGEDFFREIGSL